MEVTTDSNVHANLLHFITDYGRKRRSDTQPNDTQYNHTQQNEVQHKGRACM
jgi:hypothetical protein